MQTDPKPPNYFAYKMKDAIESRYKNMHKCFVRNSSIGRNAFITLMQFTLIYKYFGIDPAYRVFRISLGRFQEVLVSG